MRIIQYLFLLFLLSLVALSIFIATIKREFVVERTKLINSQRSTVYEYVNELKNGEDWNAMVTEGSLLNVAYSNRTVGSGSFCIWEGTEGNGEIKTINQKVNDSIIQTVDFHGNLATIAMTFKDTLGKTKVTLNAKGTLNFMSKIKGIFNGGTKTVFEMIFEKSLINLDQKLNYELKTHTIAVQGRVRKLQAFYLSQTFTSEFSKLNKNLSIVFSKITKFCENNNITIQGKPFLIYRTYDKAKSLTKVSICIPIKEAIFTTQGSEILCDTLMPFDAVKTTLTGNYSHRDEAINKTLEYIKINNLILDTKFSHLEIYTIGKNEINNPSKWLTEIYFPTRPKVVYKKIVIKPSDTLPEIPRPNQEEKISSEF